jgi:transketolase
MSDVSLKEIRKKILLAAFNAKEGHIPSALSILDILYIIYKDFLDLEKIKTSSFDRDLFILSKGHASLALYAILIENKILPENSLDDFSKYNSILGGHPDSNKVLGVEASTGSLGHGFPIAVGMALGNKIKGVNSRVITIVGDGECNEGSIWESALLCSHHMLNNITCIVDYNHSTDRALNLGNIKLKFESFGWECLSIDGHNHTEIFNSLSVKTHDRPVAIIANTIKGYGIKSMENDPSWHHKSPSESEFAELIAQIQ